MSGFRWEAICSGVRGEVCCCWSAWEREVRFWRSRRVLGGLCLAGMLVQPSSLVVCRERRGTGGRVVSPGLWVR